MIRGTRYNMDICADCGLM